MAAACSAKEAPLGPGSYEIACLSAGLACAAVEAVLKGELDNAYSLSRPPGHHCLAGPVDGILFPRQYSHCRRASESAAGAGQGGDH
ncbi:hypothetical protein LNQ03_08835 [Klebsiella pneumoniae subsp. pneumoniae]|nr:hypothetical protein [Klebsiella pneumoniae subsp. pneumoniae]